MAGEMITDQDLQDVREYLGHELCRSGELVEGKRQPDGLTALFRVIKASTALHQLIVWASVFDDFRGRGTPVSRHLRQHQVADRMKKAGNAAVVVSGPNISDIH